MVSARCILVVLLLGAGAGCKRGACDESGRVDPVVAAEDLFPPEARVCTKRPWIYPDAPHAVRTLHPGRPDAAAGPYRTRAEERGWVGETCKTAVPIVFARSETKPEHDDVRECFVRPGEPSRSLLIHATWSPAAEQSAVSLFVDFPLPGESVPDDPAAVDEFAQQQMRAAPFNLAFWVADAYGAMLDDLEAALEGTGDSTAKLQRIHDRYVRLFIRVGLRRLAFDDGEKGVFDAKFLEDLVEYGKRTTFLLVTDRVTPEGKELVQTMLSVLNHLWLRGARTEAAARTFGIELPADRAETSRLDGDGPPDDATLPSWTALVQGEFVRAMTAAIGSTGDPTARRRAMWKIHDRYVAVLLAVGLRRRSMSPAEQKHFDQAFMATYLRDSFALSALTVSCTGLDPEATEICATVRRVTDTLNLVGNGTAKAAKRLGVTLPGPDVDCDALYSLARAATLCGRAFDPARSSQDSSTGRVTCTGHFEDVERRQVSYLHRVFETVQEAEKDVREGPSARAGARKVAGIFDEAYFSPATEDANQIVLARRGRHVTAVFSEPEACPATGLQELARHALSKVGPLSQ